MWPEAKGTSRVSVAEFLSKSGNDDFSTRILTDLSKGLPIPKAAERYNLPPILIWALKLRDLDDQKKLDALSIKIQPYDVGTFCAVSSHCPFSEKEAQIWIPS